MVQKKTTKKIQFGPTKWTQSDLNFKLWDCGTTKKGYKRVVAGYLGNQSNSNVH